MKEQKRTYKLVQVVLKERVNSSLDHQNEGSGIYKKYFPIPARRSHLGYLKWMHSFSLVYWLDSPPGGAYFRINWSWREKSYLI